jgi:hypothetical protein
LPPHRKAVFSFSGFVEEGRGPSYLRYAAESLNKWVSQDADQLLDHYEHGKRTKTGPGQFRTGQPKDGEILAEAFWLIYNSANLSGRRSLLACFAFYAIGFLLLAIVFIQNFIFVVGSTL